MVEYPALFMWRKKNMVCRCGGKMGKMGKKNMWRKPACLIVAVILELDHIVQGIELVRVERYPH